MITRLGTALLLLVLLLAGTAAPASAGTPRQEYASSAFAATNEVRADHDRTRLKPDRCLKRAAARQAKAMARQESLFHQALDPLLETCGLTLVGENVASGYATGGKAVRQGWMKSAGHRANLLRKGFRRMGIAARRSEAGTWYVAQVFGRR